MKYLLVSLIAILSTYANASETCYEVSRFVVVYDTPHPSQIPIGEILNLPIELSSQLDVYTAPLNGPSVFITLADFGLPEPIQEEEPERGAHAWKHKKHRYPCFEKSALETICSDLVRYLTKRGLSGVSVQVAEDEISSSGKDHRMGHRQLTLHVRLAIVGELGAVRVDEMLPEQDRAPDPQLEFIVANSPLQPASNGSFSSDDLFSKDKLDKYLSFLNRHPNRRVDARIYSLYQDSKVGIDFLVSENRPWRTYFDVGNTGNHVTGLWQETVGVFDSQLTNVDDILFFEATTDSFHSYFTVIGSYDRPILAWPRARWKLYTMFNRYAAADLGFQDKSFVGTQAIVDLNFRETAAQKGDFFFDIVEGLRYYNIHVTNKFDDLQGKGFTQFAAPIVALSLDQIQSPLWRFSTRIEALFSPPGLFASNRNNIDFLGRLDSSKGWSILSGQFLTGFYIDTPKPVHEFIFQLKGQWGFTYRLIPQLKYVVGGFNTVRGYTEAINSGDSALVGRAEYLFHLPPIFAPNPNRKSKLFSKDFRAVPEYLGGRADWDLIFRVFLDGARSVDNDAIPNIEENSTLISTGLGTQIDLWQNFMIRVDWGITLKQAVNMDMGHSIVYLNSTLAY